MQKHCPDSCAGIHIRAKWYIDCSCSIPNTTSNHTQQLRMSNSPFQAVNVKCLKRLKPDLLFVTYITLYLMRTWIKWTWMDLEWEIRKAGFQAVSRAWKATFWPTQWLKNGIFESSCFSAEWWTGGLKTTTKNNFKTGTGTCSLITDISCSQITIICMLNRTQIIVHSTRQHITTWQWDWRLARASTGRAKSSAQNYLVHAVLAWSLRRAVRHPEDLPPQSWDVLCVTLRTYLHNPETCCASPLRTYLHNPETCCASPLRTYLHNPETCCASPLRTYLHNPETCCASPWGPTSTILRRAVRHPEDLPPQSWDVLSVTLRTYLHNPETCCASPWGPTSTILRTYLHNPETCCASPWGPTSTILRTYLHNPEDLPPQSWDLSPWDLPPQSWDVLCDLPPQSWGPTSTILRTYLHNPVAWGSALHAEFARQQLAGQAVGHILVSIGETAQAHRTNSIRLETSSHQQNQQEHTHRINSIKQETNSHQQEHTENQFHQTGK